MDTKDYEQWRTHIHELDPAQLRDLKARVSERLANSSLLTKTIIKERVQQDWLLAGIAARCRSKGVPIRGYGQLTPTNLAVVMRCSGYKVYSGVADKIKRDLDRLVPNCTRERPALAAVVTDALIAWCKDQGKFISASNVLKHSGATIEALGLCFPGYVQAGLFGIVLQGFPEKTE